MGSFKLILLLPFLTFAQERKIPDDVLHFYGSVAINETSYQVQGLLFPKRKETKKVLISNAITLSCIFAKELYDTRKRKPTGFSWDDIFVGSWAIPVYDIFNICRYDWKTRKDYSFANKHLLVP